jgi:Tfp pilus assembly protein PilZ
MMNPKPNQRQYPRRAAFFVAKYTVMEGTFQDMVGNIGAGGLFIRTKRRIAVGQPTLIEIPLLEAKNTIQVPGRVVRIDLNGIAVTFTEAVAGLIHKEGHFPEIIQEGE